MWFNDVVKYADKRKKSAGKKLVERYKKDIWKFIKAKKKICQKV